MLLCNSLFPNIKQDAPTDAGYVRANGGTSGRQNSVDTLRDRLYQVAHESVYNLRYTKFQGTLSP